MPLPGEVSLTGWRALPETGRQSEWSVQHLFYALKTLLGDEAETSIADMDLKDRQQKARALVPLIFGCSKHLIFFRWLSHVESSGIFIYHLNGSVL